MTPTSAAAPRVVWFYGLAGLIPFAAGALGGFSDNEVVLIVSRLGLAIYAGLILSFLGGARWGLEIGRASVRPAVIGLAMVPTLLAFGLLAWPHLPSRFQFVGLAAGFALQWLWDLRADGAPSWYPRLRTVLSVGALAALIAGAVAAGFEGDGPGSAHGSHTVAAKASTKAV